MAIFTKDGKVYIVEGPNPLVQKQVSWDPSKLVFHNLYWQEINQEQSKGIRKTERKTSIPIIEPIAPKEEVVTPQTQPTIEEPIQTTEETTHTTEEPRVFDLPYIKYKVLCHCLPAKVEQRTDNLYGESWGRIKYASKFVFPCVVISSSDLEFEFWTSDPRNQISEKSVVYPFSYEVHNQVTDSYDKVPYDDYRWWRISSKESKEGGWLFKSTPSDFQPDFSD